MNYWLSFQVKETGGVGVRSLAQYGSRRKYPVRTVDLRDTMNWGGLAKGCVGRASEISDVILFSQSGFKEFIICILKKI